jgi:hypothetical protein
MKLIYTEQALFSLEEALNFIALKVTHEKLIEIRDEILDAAKEGYLQRSPALPGFSCYIF